MSSPRSTFQPIRHSFPVRALRTTALGQMLLSGLSKIWKRKARRYLAILTAIITGLCSGIWSVQVVTAVAMMGIIIWTAIQLDNGGCGCH